MKAIVVDACVVIKWFIPEVHAISAALLLHKNLQFIAPDLIYAEIGNILWKKYRSKELTLDEASAILEDFKRFPLKTYENESLLDTAWQIATAHQCTLYDSLYVALAQKEGCLLVTADKALHHALSTTTLAKLTLWVEDIKK